MALMDDQFPYSKTLRDSQLRKLKEQFFEEKSAGSSRPGGTIGYTTDEFCEWMFRKTGRWADHDLLYSGVRDGLMTAEMLQNNEEVYDFGFYNEADFIQWKLTWL